MTGIETRRTAKGSTRYRAVVFDRRTGRRSYSSWGASMAAARSWRNAAQVEIDRDERAPASALTLRDFANDWIAGARAGTTRDRRGRPYKAATLRGYERGLGRVLELRSHPTDGGQPRPGGVVSLARSRDRGWEEGCAGRGALGRTATRALHSPRVDQGTHAADGARPQHGQAGVAGI